MLFACAWRKLFQGAFLTRATTTPQYIENFYFITIFYITNVVFLTNPFADMVKSKISREQLPDSCILLHLENLKNFFCKNKKF